MNSPKKLCNAMLLAAGRGERMRPLTDRTPKPLLAVHGQSLLGWHLHALARDGVQTVLVNTAWLGEQIAPHCAQLSDAPQLHFSHEGQDFGHALETAGGIARALPHLSPVFWLAAGDVFVPDFVFAQQAYDAFTASDKLAHLWLVPNPTHNPKGDFVLRDGLALDEPATPDAQNPATTTNSPRYTYSTMALLRRELFMPPWCDIAPGNPTGASAALAPLLRKAMHAHKVSASLYTGRWTDVGTPERLAQLNAQPL